MAVDIIARAMAADAQGGHVDAYTKAETDALLGAKQNTLVAGENIKNINNSSVLGSGNLEVGKIAYKHITHIRLVGQEMGDYENNNLYFTIQNYDATEITTFTQLMSNFEPYESIVVYNAELNSTNLCITKLTDTQATYSGSNTLPLDVTDEDVVVVEDHVVKL